MVYDFKYIIMQSKYRKMHNNKKNIFPDEWYNIKEYEIKKNILKDCLDKNCLIIDSHNYPILKKLALK